MKQKIDKVSKTRLRTSYITTIISIFLVLLLLGFTGIIIINANYLSNYVKENLGFSVMLKDDTREVEMFRIQKELDAMKCVKSTKFVTKEQAATQLQQELGEEFVEFLGYNPLLASIDVKFYADYANPDSIAVIENNLKVYPQIHEIFYHKSLLHTVNENIKKISTLLIGFSALLLMIAIALINNTIRLSVYSKRFLIKTMLLVGATASFIRGPFLMKGVLLGLLSAFLSIISLLFFIFFIRREFSELVVSQSYSQIGIVFLAVIVLSIIITSISTFFAVNKYVNIKSDELYI